MRKLVSVSLTVDRLISDVNNCLPTGFRCKVQLNITHSILLQLSHLGNVCVTFFFTSERLTYVVDFLMASWPLIRDQWLVLIGMQRKNHKKNKQSIKQCNNGSRPRFLNYTADSGECTVPQNFKLRPKR